MMDPMHGPWTHRHVQTNGIQMHLAEMGSGPTVVLLHGFPEFFWSWRAQLVALSEGGFHVVAPDLRGFNLTDAPEGLETYDIHHLAQDVVGLLDALDLPEATVIGHDWGGSVAWHVALAHSHRLKGVGSLNTPHLRRSLMRPTAEYARLPDRRFQYVLNWQQTGWEARWMEDPEAILDEMFPAKAVQKAFWTPEVRRIYAHAFSHHGFTPPLGYYRNLDRNWETTRLVGSRTITVPALMVTAENDPILLPSMARGMERLVPNVTFHEVHQCGHWTQQEQPEEVNRVLLAWLKELHAPPRES